MTQTILNGQIMLTYRCSAACRHCLVMASPAQAAALVSVEDAVTYGRDFASLGRRVILAGGEALLFFDHVLAICQALGDAGIPVRFIESNGSWCATDELVAGRLSQLRDAGLEGMYFSIDAYHQEFVPAERVCRGVRIARELFGVDQVYAPKVALEDAKGLEGLAADPDRLRGYARSRRVCYVGRAADELAQFVGQVGLDEIAGQHCQTELDIDHLPEIQVDPFGFVRPDLCPGVNLGSTRSERLADLGRTQRVRETPLLAEIAERGPTALLSLARRAGFTPQPTYATKCHLCFGIRRHLVEPMHAAFGPKHLYGVCSGAAAAG